MYSRDSFISVYKREQVVQQQGREFHWEKRRRDTAQRSVMGPKEKEEEKEVVDDVVEDEKGRLYRRWDIRSGRSAATLDWSYLLSGYNYFISDVLTKCVTACK